MSRLESGVPRSRLVLDAEEYPRRFRHEPGIENVISVLFDADADEWRRTWRSEVGWTPRREALFDAHDLSRSAAAAGSPSTRVLPDRDLALTNCERPVDPGELTGTVEEYLRGCVEHETVVFVDAVEELVADAGTDAAVSAVERIASAAADVDGRTVLCLEPATVDDGLVESLASVVEEVEGESEDDVSAAIDALRTRDPTTFGYTRSNWREAREGIERCSRNYPQSKQVHAAIDDPETTPRTLGATLSGLVELGVIDTWSETVGSTRYDLTAYDGDRLAAVGTALDAVE